MSARAVPSRPAHDLGLPPWLPLDSGLLPTEPPADPVAVAGKRAGTKRSRRGRDGAHAKHIAVSFPIDKQQLLAKKRISAEEERRMRRFDPSFSKKSAQYLLANQTPQRMLAFEGTLKRERLAFDSKSCGPSPASVADNREKIQSGGARFRGENLYLLRALARPASAHVQHGNESSHRKTAAVTRPFSAQPSRASGRNQAARGLNADNAQDVAGSPATRRALSSPQRGERARGSIEADGAGTDSREHVAGVRTEQDRPGKEVPVTALAAADCVLRPASARPSSGMGLSASRLPHRPASALPAQLRTEDRDSVAIIDDYRNCQENSEAFMGDDSMTASISLDLTSRPFQNQHLATNVSNDVRDERAVDYESYVASVLEMRGLRNSKVPWHKRGLLAGKKSQQEVCRRDVEGRAFAKDAERMAKKGMKVEVVQEKGTDISASFFASDDWQIAYRLNGCGRLEEFKQKTKVVAEGVREKLRKIFGNDSESTGEDKNVSQPAEPVFRALVLGAEHQERSTVIRDKLFDEARQGGTSLVHGQRVRGSRVMRQEWIKSRVEERLTCHRDETARKQLQQRIVRARQDLARRAKFAKQDALAGPAKRMLLNQEFSADGDASRCKNTCNTDLSEGSQHEEQTSEPTRMQESISAYCPPWKDKTCPQELPNSVRLQWTLGRDAGISLPWEPVLAAKDRDEARRQELNARNARKNLCKQATFNQKYRWSQLSPRSVIEATMLGPATLEVTVIAGKDLIAADDNGKSDPYLRLHIGDEVDKGQQTHVIKKTLNPMWNQTFCFELNTSNMNSDSLVLECFDYDLALGNAADDSLGTCSIPLASLKPVQDGVATLIITVVSASDLPAADKSGTSDPYMILHVGDVMKDSQKTKVIKKQLNPEWNESFHFELNSSMQKQTLKLQCFDFDEGFTDDELLGRSSINLAGIVFNREYDVWYTLHRASQADGSAKARARLKYKMVPNGFTEWFGLSQQSSQSNATIKGQVQLRYKMMPTMPSDICAAPADSDSLTVESG